MRSEHIIELIGIKIPYKKKKPTVKIIIIQSQTLKFCVHTRGNNFPGTTNNK